MEAAMMVYSTAYAGALSALVLADMIWLGSMVSRFTARHSGIFSFPVSICRPQSSSTCCIRSLF
jgi:hypothetical protein